jgi:hypothetical protein
MKYKVTVTSTDLTGHEDVEVQEIINYDYLPSIVAENFDKRILIEPQPEKQKVTVWFYVFEDKNRVLNSKSNTSKDALLINYNISARAGRKVSEIKSIEVEI